VKGVELVRREGIKVREKEGYNGGRRGVGMKPIIGSGETY
jgi:hypothetical protein